jgi:hypothetical protein
MKLLTKCYILISLILIELSTSYERRTHNKVHMLEKRLEAAEKKVAVLTEALRSK